MENKNIKYKLSTDYELLYNLLKSGYHVVGFIAIDLRDNPSPDYSKIVEMRYNSAWESFDLGFTFLERDFDKMDFKTLCEKYMLRFFPLNYT